MKDILWLVKNTIKVTFINKMNYIIFFMVPLLGVVIALLAYGNNDTSSLNIGVVNKEKNYITDDAIDYLKSIGNFNVENIDKGEVHDKVISKDVDVVITFDTGFTDSIYSGKPNGIEITSIKGIETTAFVKSYLYDYVDNLVNISNISKENNIQFKTLYDKYEKDKINVNVSKVKDNSKNKDMTNQSIGFLLLISLMSSGNLAEIIIKERRDRTFFRISASPIDSKRYIISNLLVNIIVLFIQNAVTLIAMIYIFNIDTKVPFMEMLAILTIFSIVSIGVSLMIISFSKDSSSLSAMQTLIFVLTSQISGSFIDVSIMPEYLQRIAKFMPQRWALDAIDKLQTQGFNSIYMNIVVLLAFAATFFLIAIYKFANINDTRDFV